MLRQLSVSLAAICLLAASSASAATDYTYQQCAGSARPYPATVNTTPLPDSLRVVFINHVGRHGARYPSSDKACMAVRRLLTDAQRNNSLTPTGKELLALTDQIITLSAGNWGALDSLGMAEQRGIAERMMDAYPELLGQGAVIHAYASYKPRCIMSMFEFLHQITRMADKAPEISTVSGPSVTPLLRFFDTDSQYHALLESGQLKMVWDKYLLATIPDAPLRRLIGNNLPAEPVKRAEALLNIYSVVAGAAAMGVESHPERFFSLPEYNALWSARNLKQYLEYSASGISSVPADMAAPLLQDLIATTDSALEGSGPDAILRFGHAETLMPLLSLMHLGGAYYPTCDWNAVCGHWHNFELVPMAANLQMIVCRGPSGRAYVRVELNEQPVQPIEGYADTIVPWALLRQHLTELLPR